MNIEVVEVLFGGGPILLGILIALTAALKWPKALNYIWAAVSVVFGIIVYALM